MSILKVNTIQDKGGNTLLVSDGAGTISSGGLMTMTPAFHAKRTSGQTGVTDNTITKVQCDVEVFDSNSCYDNSTNYRFTPTVAGKYYIYGAILGANDAFSNSILNQVFAVIYKNGSQYTRNEWAFSTNYLRYVTPTVASVIDFNGSTDYVELYGQVDSTDGSAVQFYGSTGAEYTIFGGYRIIGA